MNSIALQVYLIFTLHRIKSEQLFNTAHLLNRYYRKSSIFKPRKAICGAFFLPLSTTLFFTYPKF